MKIKLNSIARQLHGEIAMEELFAGELSVAEGLRGSPADDLEDGEVVVLSKESWVKVCHETATELPWLAHGANLFIKGFEFLPTDIGRTLCIGEAILEIVRGAEPGACLRQQAPEIIEALQMGWRGGVVCRVLRSGNIQTGDDVLLGK